MRLFLWHPARAAYKQDCGDIAQPRHQHVVVLASSPKQACAAIARLVSMQETIEEEGFKRCSALSTYCSTVLAFSRSEVVFAAIL